MYIFIVQTKFHSYLQFCSYIRYMQNIISQLKPKRKTIPEGQSFKFLLFGFGCVKDLDGFDDGFYCAFDSEFAAVNA